MKVGFSKDVLIFIPQDVIVLCLKPTLILVKGIDKYSVSLTAHKIKSVKNPTHIKVRVSDMKMKLFISNLVNKNSNKIHGTNFW